jgi:hypothetical protein
MTKAILIDTPDGWVIRHATRNLLFTGLAFRTRTAARKYLAEAWPNVEVVKISQSNYSY